MRKFISLIGILSIVLLSSANAQEIQSSTVPEKVTAAFVKNYPSVQTIKWFKSGVNYVAKFTIAIGQVSFIMDADGKFVLRETRVTVSKLPQNAQNYLTLHYAGVTFDEVIEVLNAKDYTSYKVMTKGKMVWFDGRGNFIKEEEI